MHERASGMVSLRPLYDFVERYKDSPSLSGRSKIGRLYGRNVMEAVRTVPDASGFYLWGYYEDAERPWHSVYLGRAGSGKTTSLHARIGEELKDERVFVWRHVLPKKELLQKLKSDYPSKGGYQWASKRALRKADCTHIVWCAAPDFTREQVGQVEADLIELFNPKANRDRPAPKKDVQDRTMEVAAEFRTRIHEYRSGGFSTKLVR